ncbi:MAG: dTDP-4-dehydrorhamnose 3,5-epimerase [Planctomycetes bacterium]|nr:dTDP-4-dehydrorhamnose 3,5-epimerase [Planctomycetota bacterium]
MPFQFKKLEIPEVLLVEPRIFSDSRGFFMETYKRSEFVANGIPDLFVQDNHSHSTKGTLRGLHYQKLPQAQGKLVMAVKGEIFDVVVDIRRGSPHYGHWVGEVLSATNHWMLWVPAGFAHGFCVLSETADVFYKCTDFYHPEHERTLLWNDPDVNIQWPLQGEPILSDKDRNGTLLSEIETFEM